MSFAITKVQLIEGQDGAIEAKPYYKAAIHGKAGGVLDMHLVPGDFVELESFENDDDALIIDPADFQAAYGRLVELHRDTD